MPSPGPYHPVSVHVGGRLRVLRLKRGLNQVDIAGVLGVSLAQFQKYESGKNHLSAPRLYTLSQKLNVNVGYFFEGL